MEAMTVIDREPGTCRRCHRTDLPMVSNGYCSRCDDVLYGRKNVAPTGWPEPAEVPIAVFGEGEKDAGKRSE